MTPSKNSSKPIRTRRNNWNLYFLNILLILLFKNTNINTRTVSMSKYIPSVPKGSNFPNPKKKEKRIIAK